MSTSRPTLGIPFAPLSEISHGALLETSLSDSTTPYTHGLHRFPAKYIPQVPRWALREFLPPGGHVLDPFMGSGTTLVESVVAGARSTGVDIDPLAGLISRAKTAEVSGERLVELGAAVLSSASSESRRDLLPMSGVVNPTHWFGSDALAELWGLFESIDAVQASEVERDVLRVVFSSILRRVSRADDQSQKTYVSGTLLKSPAPVLPTFSRAIQRAAIGLTELGAARHGKASPLVGSALDLPLEESTVDLIVTSPPYLDSVDYMYNLMLEYFWLGPILGVPDRASFNSRRRGSVGGTRRVEEVHDIAARLIDSARLASYRVDASLAYLELMRRHFVEAARVLTTSGRYVLVVGNSGSRGRDLPIADWLIELAADVGLDVEKAFAYRVRRHSMRFPRMGRGGIILADWIIVLKSSSRPAVEPLPDLGLSIPADQVAH